jgi:hypothetical protein
MFSRSNLLKLVILLLGTYCLYKSLSSSLFFRPKERLNIVFYGASTTFYSISTANANTSYAVLFPSDLEILIPGGYGHYRVGALGKLVSLEKQPRIYKKAFSVNTSSFLDGYFYPKNPEVYYGSSVSEERTPSLRDIFFNQTNVNFFDRLYIAMVFANKRPGWLRTIKNLPQTKTGKRQVFDRDEFVKEYQGYFYKKTYREVRQDVQIIYSKSYNTAFMMSQVIEGEGIRVADLTASDNNRGDCLIIENNRGKFSAVAEDLAKFFNCRLTKGKTEISDIIIMLNGAEKEWSAI